MSYLTESYQSFKDFRKFLTANDFEVIQVTLNTDNKVEYYKDSTHFGHIVIQYPVQERINPFTKKPETPSVRFEMFIREPLFTTLNSPIFPRQDHYDKVLKDFEKFQTMINLIYNDSNERIAKNLTEDQVITFANDEFAETDNIDDAIENDQLFYDNIYDAQESLEAFGFTLIKK